MDTASGMSVAAPYICWILILYMTMFKLGKLILVIGVLFVVCPLLFFVVKFHDFGISESPKDWIDFGMFYFAMMGILFTGYIAVVVNNINIQTSKVGLQFEAYKELVSILTGLTDYIKPMTKTNKEVDIKIVETVRNLNHFTENYLFLFEQVNLNRFHDYIQLLVQANSKNRDRRETDIFGPLGTEGEEIINATNHLLNYM
jgi:hypothetical protein